MRVLFRRRLIGIAAVVGDVEAGSFEDEAGADADFAFHRTGAGLDGAVGEVRVLHGLLGLELMATGLAFVVVGWHG